MIFLKIMASLKISNNSKSRKNARSRRKGVVGGAAAEWWSGERSSWQEEGLAEQASSDKFSTFFVKNTYLIKIIQQKPFILMFFIN